jgi:hypothetical protein
MPGNATRNKSLFASFSSEKEEVLFFEKRTKKLLCPRSFGLVVCLGSDGFRTE